MSDPKNPSGLPLDNQVYALTRALLGITEVLQKMDGHLVTDHRVKLQNIHNLLYSYWFGD